MKALNEEEPNADAASDGPSSIPDTNLYGLESVPPEILSEIEMKLSMQDAFSLRLTSKELATRVSLTQDFWRRRLTAGELFGLGNLDGDALKSIGKGRDWKGLLRILARYENFMGEETGKPMEQWGDLHDAPLCLKNHMRIWKVISELLRGIDRA